MIGNDIIDLTLAQKESNWQRKGFLAKIFTSREQSLIVQSENPEIMVWNLWSRKEAAYKIYNRQTQLRAYMPLQLDCFDLATKDGMHYGKVHCFDQIYYTKTLITDYLIDTVAVVNPDDFDRIITLDSLISIKKTNGIPFYFPSEGIAPRALSKSHHGRFERIVTLFD